MLSTGFQCVLNSGFDNIRTFKRLFKEKYGKTPVEFRVK